MSHVCPFTFLFEALNEWLLQFTVHFVIKAMPIRSINTVKLQKLLLQLHFASIGLGMDTHAYLLYGCKTPDMCQPQTKVLMVPMMGENWHG